MLSGALNTQAITKLSQIGAAITGEMEHILLNDVYSQRFKENQAQILEEIQKEEALEQLAAFLQYQEKLKNNYERSEFAEKQALAQAQENKRIEILNEQYEKISNKPITISRDELQVAAAFAQLADACVEVAKTEQALQRVADKQADIVEDWKKEKTAVLSDLKEIPILVHGEPLMVPSEDGEERVAAIIRFDADSVEGERLRERLAAAPLPTQLLEKLPHVHEAYVERVKEHQAGLVNNNPAYKRDPASLVFDASIKAQQELVIPKTRVIEDLNIGIAVYNQLLRLHGPQYINKLVMAFKVEINDNWEKPGLPAFMKLYSFSLNQFRIKKPPVQVGEDLNSQYLRAEREKEKLAAKHQAAVALLQAGLNTLLKLGTHSSECARLGELLQSPNSLSLKSS